MTVQPLQLFKPTMTLVEKENYLTQCQGEIDALGALLLSIDDYANQAEIVNEASRKYRDIAGRCRPNLDILFQQRFSKAEAAINLLTAHGENCTKLFKKLVAPYLPRDETEATPSKSEAMKVDHYRDIPSGTVSRQKALIVEHLRNTSNQKPPAESTAPVVRVHMPSTTVETKA